MAAARGLQPEERTKHLLMELIGNAGAAVLDANDDLIGAGLEAHIGPLPIFDGVLDQISEAPARGNAAAPVGTAPAGVECAREEARTVTQTIETGCFCGDCVSSSETGCYKKLQSGHTRETSQGQDPSTREIGLGRSAESFLSPLVLLPCPLATRAAIRQRQTTGEPPRSSHDEAKCERPKRLL